jgi:hypothetical protein
MQILSGKFDANIVEGQVGFSGFVDTDLFGGGQRWFFSVDSMEEVLDTVYKIIVRDCVNGEVLPKEVEEDVKVGIARRLFRGHITDKYGG